MVTCEDVAAGGDVDQWILNYSYIKEEILECHEIG